jgi:hypothetical protein
MSPPGSDGGLGLGVCVHEVVGTGPLTLARNSVTAQPVPRLVWRRHQV